MVTTPVRLMNEYSVKWPIWGTGDNYPYQVGVLPLSKELTGHLLGWAERFNQLYDHELGWPSELIAESHFEEGHRLAADLQGELGDAYQVTLSLWETNFQG